MLIVRNTFVAKPGQAGKLLAQLKDIAEGSPLRNVRFLTDLVGEFNQVIMEHDVESMAEFEQGMEQYMSNPQIREKAKGYTEHWMSGKREMFRVV